MLFDRDDLVHVFMSNCKLQIECFIHLLYCTRHYQKETKQQQCPRNKNNYISIIDDFSGARLSLEGITSKYNLGSGHLMGPVGSCRCLAGSDGVISKGLHSCELSSELKLRKGISGDRCSFATTKQFCLTQDLST